MFLGVCSIGEARELLNLTSLKLLQFVYFQNCRNSDRRDNFNEANFAFLYIRKHSVYTTNQTKNCRIGAKLVD